MIRLILNRIKKIADISKFDVLDCFGGKGIHQTGYLHDKFNSLTIWEINPRCEDALRDNLPNASIKICDAFEEILTVEEKFDLVIMDHSISMSDYHVESHDLFPYVFRILKDYAFILPQIMYPGKYYKRQNIFSAVPYKIVEARKRFFKAYDTDGDMIPLDQACGRYCELAGENGFKVGSASLLVARNHVNLDWFYYLLELKRMPQRHEDTKF